MLEMKSVKDISLIKPHGPYQLREPPLENTDGMYKFCLFFKYFVFLMNFFVKCKKLTELLALSDSSIGLDLIIVPGLGFTKKCHRIGHGKGFYDTYITHCNKWSQENNRKRPLLVGIGAEQQLVDHIPLEEHDIPLDFLIINGQVYKHTAQKE